MIRLELLSVRWCHKLYIDNVLKSHGVGKSKLIKSLQHIVTSTVGSISINPVDVNKSVLLCNGMRTLGSSGTTPQNCLMRAELTDSSHITTFAVASGGLISLEIIEFAVPVKSIQKGTINAGETINITPVDLTKSFLFWGGYSLVSSNGSAASWAGMPTVVYLVGNNQIACQDSNEYISTVANWTLVELI